MDYAEAHTMINKWLSSNTQHRVTIALPSYELAMSMFKHLSNSFKDVVFHVEPRDYHHVVIGEHKEKKEKR